eukprot:4845755-Amphidinium_carterae.1
MHNFGSVCVLHGGALIRCGDNRTLHLAAVVRATDLNADSVAPESGHKGHVHATTEELQLIISQPTEDYRFNEATTQYLAAEVLCQTVMRCLDGWLLALSLRHPPKHPSSKMSKPCVAKSRNKAWFAHLLIMT